MGADLEAGKQESQSDRHPESPHGGGGFRAWLRQFCHPKAFRIDSQRRPKRMKGSLEQAQVGNGKNIPESTTRGRDEAHKSIDSDTYSLISDLATGIWRIKRRIDRESRDQDSDEWRGIYRHMEATCDLLEKHRIEVKDDIGHKYVVGMAAQVLAFQPSADVDQETIIETVRPSVYYKDILIQRGEVIVATPMATEDNCDAMVVTRESTSQESIAVAVATVTADGSSTPPLGHEAVDTSSDTPPNRD
jgi:hypothetical protein